ncbi:helix-turn-helix domain-containing protein [Paenibacillus sp. NRS-1783]|uniref:helix-turn-helix domain-containing protein n=1 Tax=unclassified Paenibacillus TaxID=185978 RepID=UPI003D2D2926
MISYEPLRILLVKRNIKKMDFIAKVGLSPTTAAKLWKDDYVHLNVINRICETYNLTTITDVLEYKREETGLE